MQQPGFIFGGQTGLTYDQIQKQRDIANELLRANMSTPQNVGEGLSAIGRALAAKAIDKRTSRADDVNRKAYEAERDRAFQALGGFGATGGGSAGYSPSGTWTPAPPPPKPTDSFMGNPDTVFSGGNSFNMPAPADAAQPSAPLSFGSAVMTPQEMLIAGAEARGLNPIDVATAISYETGGKFDPLIKGPTTQWGQHEGLIQFGDPQGQEHGAVFDQGADAAWRSQLNPSTGAVWSYLDSTGVKPGMGLDQIYSAINAGGVNRFGASDANNGGAPGTVADKVAGMGPHRENAAKFLGGTWTPTEGQAGAAPQPAVGAPAGGMGSPAIIMALAGIQGNPYASDSDKAIANILIEQTIQSMDPMRQMEMERARLELDALKNPQPEFTQLSPQEVAQLGLPPGVYQRGPDGRIDTVEKTQGVVDPIAELRARATAAGLQEGTPEFQQFMLAGGKTDSGMVIESDGQGGFRMVQGAGATGAAAKPFTEGQSKDVVYATRAKGALEALDPIANALTDRGDVAAGMLPFGLGGGMQNDNYQVAKTAGDEFLQAILRKDTGAAITSDEQALYGETYLPKPGDNEARLAYKAQARQRAVAAIEAGMSPAQIIAQEKALSEGPQASAPAANDAGFAEFAATPSAIAAAEKYGVTLEEMWAIKQGQQ
jgi:hypothetical protein